MARLTERISCADFTFPLLPNAGALRLIKMMGIDAVDLGLFSGRSHIQPERVRSDPVGAAKALMAQLSGIGLQLADVFLQTGPEPHILSANHPDAAIRDQSRELFKAAVEFTHACGCRHLTGLPGVAHAGFKDSDSRALAGAEASWRAGMAATAGITYAVEAHVGSICPSPEATLDFLARSQGVTLTLDYGHFISQGMTNESVRPLLGRASHFHARAGCKDRLQATLQRNEIDFGQILVGLSQSGYQGFLCLEYVWIDWEHCNEVDNVSETIRLRNHLQNLERRSTLPS